MDCWFTSEIVTLQASVAFDWNVTGSLLGVPLPIMMLASNTDVISKEKSSLALCIKRDPRLKVKHKLHDIPSRTISPTHV